MCIEDARAQKLPAHLRRSLPLPCKVHGDPRDVWPELRIYISLYALLRPYHEIRYDSDSKPLYYLTLSLLHILCTEAQIGYLQAIDFLTILHTHLDGGSNG
jgi:hypothetical protein